MRGKPGGQLPQRPNPGTLGAEKGGRRKEAEAVTVPGELPCSGKPLARRVLLWEERSFRSFQSCECSFREGKSLRLIRR